MKTTILTILLLITGKCFCQNTAVPKIENDTLYTASGYKITAGQEIKLGIGTKDNGDFKYISASNSFLPNAREQSLKRTKNGHTVIVKKLKPEGNSKNGYVYYIVVGVGEPVNYQCDVESAITAGEIIVPDQYKTKTTSAQPLSVADELAKLKKLYDDSVITKEEYEAQKKKLLDGN